MVMLSNLKLVREIFIFVTDRTERVFLYRIRMTERSSWKKSSNLPRKTTNIKKNMNVTLLDIICVIHSNLYTRIIKIFTFYFGNLVIIIITTQILTKQSVLRK